MAEPDEEVVEEESPKASRSKRTKKTKPEKKSKKSKKRVVLEEDMVVGGGNELFGLETVSSPPDKPQSSFKPLAEDENLAMVLFRISCDFTEIFSCDRSLT